MPAPAIAEPSSPPIRFSTLVPLLPPFFFNPTCNLLGIFRALPLSGSLITFVTPGSPSAQLTPRARCNTLWLSASLGPGCEDDLRLGWLTLDVLIQQHGMKQGQAGRANGSGSGSGGPGRESVLGQDGCSRFTRWVACGRAAATGRCSSPTPHRASPPGSAARCGGGGESRKRRREEEGEGY